MELCGLGMDHGDSMLLEHERNYGLGMDALVTICSGKAHGITVWAWMLWRPSFLRTRALSLFWHGCLRTKGRFGHGCTVRRMFLEHARNYGLGMDARVTVCSWKVNGIMWFGHGSW